MKIYTNRSNAARAAKKQFGAGNFVVTGSGKEWGFEAKTGAPEVKEAKPAKAKAKAEPKVKRDVKLSDQPQMQKLIKLMQRASGVTVVEAAEALGGIEQHTVRGSVSRLRKEIKAITVTREVRTVRYHLAKDAEV
jgi:hypothetical protein